MNNHHSAIHQNTDSSKKTSPIDITAHLKGVHFPTDKNSLIELAKSNRAPSEVIQIIENFNEGTQFNSVTDITKEVSNSE